MAALPLMAQTSPVVEPDTPVVAPPGREAGPNRARSESGVRRSGADSVVASVVEPAERDESRADTTSRRRLATIPVLVGCRSWMCPLSCSTGLQYPPNASIDGRSPWIGSPSQPHRPWVMEDAGVVSAYR